MSVDSELHFETEKYIESTDVKVRKKYGQYFTIKSIRDHLFSELFKYLNKSRKMDILDPACGTGEFLISCKEYFPKSNLYGFDISEKVLNVSQMIVPEAKLEVNDTLKLKSNKKYDLVIGNPPYFEFKPDKELKTEYGDLFSGRVNIYGLFIKKSLNMLKDNGYLAFVIPPSLNSSSYFSKVRRYIVSNSDIVYLKVLDNPSHFKDANQKVMLIILKKTTNKGKYLVKVNNKIFFSENYLNIRKKLKNKTFLKDLNYTVKTGEIVWNLNKNLLTENPSDVLLIWSHNISNCGLKLFTKGEKKQYIKSKRYNLGPAIVVNRIVGQPGKMQVRASKIEKGVRFLAENHVNVIFPVNKLNKPKLSIDSLLEQLHSKENELIMNEIIGNTQISKTELEELFPLNLKFKNI